MLLYLVPGVTLAGIVHTSTRPGVPMLYQYQCNLMPCLTLTLTLKGPILNNGGKFTPTTREDGRTHAHTSWRDSISIRTNHTAVDSLTTAVRAVRIAASVRSAVSIRSSVVVLLILVSV